MMSTNFEERKKSQQKSLQMANHLVDKTNVAMFLSRRYEQLLHSERHYDCVFHIGNAQLKCHKLILSAVSPVFDAMFYGPIREENLHIDILDISIDIFKLLMSYIYTGVGNYEHLTLEETIELYYAAEKYLINELINDCLVAIKRKLRFTNILPALELSVCLDLCSLLDVCMSFFTHCCLSDAQYMAYLKTNYVHMTKDCIKTIIAANKDMHKQLLWFVYEWCQHECHELGMQPSDCTLLIDDLQLQHATSAVAGASDKLRLQQGRSIERNYYKACRPFTIDGDANLWRIYVKCDRFILLQGLIMHSRLTPTLLLGFPSDYKECLCVEISAQPQQRALAVVGYSDGEDSDHEADMEQEHEQEHFTWRHSVAQERTKYNCDMNIRWDEGVVLSPDIEYEIKLMWQADSYGAEYPCSLQSNTVDGIQFRDSDINCGSLIKGLHFVNLV